MQGRSELELAGDTRIAASPTESIWQGLKKAIRGSEADYTQIGIGRAVFLLAVPMILELVMESTFAVVDIYFVSSLGPSAVATVGLTETYLFLLYAIGIGLAMGVTAVVARRIGEQKRDEAGVSAVQAILIAGLASIPFALAGILFAKDLLALMGADGWALAHGYRYAQWMLGGNAVIMLLFVINAIFRGAGDPAQAMWVLWVANACNIVLDPVLILGLGPFPALGIEGAAIATNVGRGVGVLMQFYLLFRGGRHIRLVRDQLVVHWGILTNIVRTSLGGVGQMVVGMTSWIFVMRIIASFGSQAVAGATIALRIMMFSLMPAWGMSNAVATLVGQNLGAQKPDRAERAVWVTGFWNMLFLIAVAIAYFLLSETLVGIFTERDIMHCFAKGVNFKTEIMKNVMTPSPVILDASTDISVAIGLMSDRKIRHLPVMENAPLPCFLSHEPYILRSSFCRSLISSIATNQTLAIPFRMERP